MVVDHLMCTCIYSLCIECALPPLAQHAFPPYYCQLFPWTTAMPNLSDDPALAGLFATLNVPDQPSATAIVDDYEAEQETLLDDEPDKGITQLEDTVRNASK